MMQSPWDSSIKLFYAADLNSFFTITDIARGASFDVIANVEIGERLAEVVDSYELRVGVRNITQSCSVAVVQTVMNLTPQVDVPILSEIRVNIPGGWSANAEVGDVLQAVASFKVNAGVNVNFSTANSNTLVVTEF